MPTWIHVISFRIRALLSARRIDRELDTELASHLELLAADEAARGLSPAEAQRSARLRLGGTTQLIEHHREQRRLPFLDTTIRDLAYAARSLWHQPVFSLV